MIIVTDQGFKEDDRPAKLEAGTYREITVDDLSQGLDGPPAQTSLVLQPGDNVEAASAFLDRLSNIVVAFPSSADGRGFSMARRLRRLGYDGQLIAQGHVIADQYAHARRCGFDVVAIDEALAQRQPEAQWTSQTARINVTYQNRLQQAAEIA